jgi:diaminopimelate decarboxylase
MQNMRLNRFMNDEELIDVISRFGTPLYIIDENTLHAKVKELLDAYSGFKGRRQIAYSIKANFNPAVIRAFIKDGIMFDLTSLGELYFYRMCAGNVDDVIYTSVAEEESEYKEVLSTNVSRIVVSSYNGLMNVIRAAERLNLKPKVMIRINPEVGVKAEVKASYRHGKFGVPFNTNARDSATNMIKYIMNNAMDKISFEGFHFHLGSQITDYTCFAHALDRLDAFIANMKKSYPRLDVNTIDIGGGTPVSYGEYVPTPYEIASSIVDRLNRIADNYNKELMLIVESGRYLTAESTILVSRIVNTKEYTNDRFIIADSGYHILLDAALLKQEYPQEIFPKDGQAMNNHKTGSNGNRIHLVGRLCDTYDVFPISKISTLHDAMENKYVIFYNVGAYSIVFNMPFHCQTKPPIFMKRSDGKIALVRKPTSIEELFIEEGGDLA